VVDKKTADLANALALLIRDAFDGYSDEFLRITRRAKPRFEHRDWIGEHGRHKDALTRLDLYEKTLDRIAVKVGKMLGEKRGNRAIWRAARREYAALLPRRHDMELAQTFFNSATRKILGTVGINRRIEFFHLRSKVRRVQSADPVYHTYHNTKGTEALVRQILQEQRFKRRYENLDRDARLVANEIDLYLWPMAGSGKPESIDIVMAPFFRNKAAYIVGRINIEGVRIPIVMPLYSIDSGIFVDTVLLREENVSRVFGFAHSYFHVEVHRHDALIGFLKSILPQKPVAELYISIGYNRHGKTELYRDLHHFIHESREQFVIAPGKEGAVMLVYTLPDFNFVFKIIKDRPCFLRTQDITDKRTTRAEVMSKYNLVCRRDRVGRMVDTQDFENLRFRKKRFTKALMAEFAQAAKEIVTIEDEYVVVKHCYLQRKVIPLPMYLEQEKDPEAIRHIIIDFGFFFKDLAAAGIFPCDLFNIWNYGVTRRRRVVLFDYDDVEPLEQAQFKERPQPRDDLDVLSPEEERIAAMPCDFFVDEIERYSGVPHSLKGLFKSAHGDLFTVDYWKDVKRRLKRGEIIDITPYDRRMRFRNRLLSYDIEH